MEQMTPTRKFQKEINAGITSLVLLSVMERAREPMYGYQIAKEIDFGGERGPSLKQSALYPVLRSLQKYGLLESEVEPSVSGPPRRYYKITAEGQSTLTEWKTIWSDVKKTVDTLIEGDTND